MAPKRPSHLDEPPAASSSEEAEEASSEEEEEDDEEEDPSEDEQEKTPKKAPALASKPQASESDDESSSESEPDNSTVKPIASKPMEEAATPAAKPKKPRSKPAAAAAAVAASPAKRPAESEPAKGSKRAKKKSSDAAAEAENNGAASVASEDEPKKLGGGDEKKLFQRLWSEDDEIVILKGIIDYTAKKGSDPSADMGAFHDFIKKSLHIDVSKSQLTDKVRRLRKKYENNSAKKKYDPSKAHEKKAFELSKKIWGGVGGGGEEPRSNGAAVRTAPRSNGKTLASLKAELISSPEPVREAEKVGIDGNGGGLGSEIFGFDKSLPEYVVKLGLGLVSEEKKAELEAKWKKIHIAQLELFVKRTQLMSEQGKLILEALKSSDH